MPWTASEFSSRHNHKLHGEAASKAASMATAMVREGVPERIAIATANKHGDKMLREHHARGGGAFGLSVTHANPLKPVATPHVVEGIGLRPRFSVGGIGHIGHVGHISMPHLGSNGAGGLNVGSGATKLMSPSQGTPFWTRSAAHGMTGGIGGIGHTHLAIGGMGASTESPWWERQDARDMIHDVSFNGGLIPGSGGGRTDQIPMSVPAGSHVMTADSISGMGQGNTASGARNLLMALRIGPYGVPVPQKITGHGPPHAPAVPKLFSDQSSTNLPAVRRGGAPHSDGKRRTSVLVASGEMIIPNDDWLAEDDVDGKTYLHRGVRSLGRDWYEDHGEIASHADCENKGHELLDNVHKLVRHFNIKWLKHAPPPKK